MAFSAALYQAASLELFVDNISTFLKSSGLSFGFLSQPHSFPNISTWQLSDALCQIVS
jgi:hypothetical protein